MTNWLIILFFGFALAIGIYFTCILLRVEMYGKPKPPPVGDDFGFAPKSSRTPSSDNIRFLHPRH